MRTQGLIQTEMDTSTRAHTRRRPKGADFEVDA